MKKITVYALCIALILTQLSACSQTESVPPTVESSAPTVAVETPKETAPETAPPEDLNASAEQAYMDFLNGKAVVTTSELFREDDQEFNYDGLTYGSYSYSELKAKIAEREMSPAETKYAFVDLGRDGVNELILRFENTDPSFMNWTGVIKYNGEGLDLNYYYEDGYRTYSNLYTSGYLELGGSVSAAESAYTLIALDENGVGREQFSCNMIYGVSAANIIYDLTGSLETGGYDDIADSSQLQVTELKADGNIKVAVDVWSEDAAVRAREEELINGLVDKGAELISTEEMEALCSTSQYTVEEVSWLDWGEGLISADYASDELLANTESYDSFVADSSEYQVNVVFTTDVTVTEVSVLSLAFVDVDDAGVASFSAEKLYSQPELTPDRPLVVGMVFVGDIPNMGISYTDAAGTAHVCSINMSGMDGSLLLYEIDLYTE